MTTIDIPVAVNPAVALCVERAQHHQQLAADASTDEERRAHEATMRSLDKAALEIVKGNSPRYAGAGAALKFGDKRGLHTETEKVTAVRG